MCDDDLDNTILSAVIVAGVVVVVVVITMLSSCLQGIMLVYDVTTEKSFENIRNWIRNIEEVRTGLEN